MHGVMIVNEPAETPAEPRDVAERAWLAWRSGPSMGRLNVSPAEMEQAIERRLSHRRSVIVARRDRPGGNRPAGTIGATWSLRGGMRGATVVHHRHAGTRELRCPLAERVARQLACAERLGRCDWHDRAAETARGIGLAVVEGPNVAADRAERDAAARLAGIAAHLRGLEHDRQRREARAAAETARARAIDARLRKQRSRLAVAEREAAAAALAGDAVLAETLAERARDMADTLAEHDADLGDARAAARLARDLAEGARDRLAELRQAQAREAARLAVAQAQLVNARREERQARKALQALIERRPVAHPDHAVSGQGRWVAQDTAHLFNAAPAVKVRPGGATTAAKPIKHRARRRKVTSINGARISSKPAGIR
jgi:hypothetical protein